MTDIHALLQAAFAGELAEHVAAIRTALGAASAGEDVDLRDIFRRAHSLKGAARAVEQPDTEALAHDLETLLAAVERGTRSLDAATVAEISGRIDAIEDAGGGVVRGESPVESATESVVESAAAPRPIGDMLRVSPEHVERLARSIHGLGSQAREKAGLSEGLIALDIELRAIAALAEQGSQDVAPRLSRAIADLARLRRAQVRLHWGLDRAIAELEGDAERIMLVPAHILFGGFDRMVRDVASAQGKLAAFRGDGGEVEADRRVLQALREPVMHLLRNAVGHGIEPVAVRRRAGKPELGLVTIEVHAERGELVVVVADDGGGLDQAKIAAKARRAGLIAAGEATPADAELHALLFEQGFSTAETVDEISGRGIGLSVVAEAVRRLHGRVGIAPAPGGGTRVTLAVPQAIARQTVLLFEVAGASYGVPASAVAQVLRLAPGDIDRTAGREVTLVDDLAVPLAAAADLLGTARATSTGGPLAALLLRVGGTRLALVVDALLDVRTLVVGDPTAIAADVPLVYGTGLLDDGGVALVLSPDAIVERVRSRRGAAPLAPAAQAEAAAARRRTILVVDDSITTRTLEKSILEAQGYAVLLSVDGLDGLERLRSNVGGIDLVVADVEMPRMDGFGLLGAIRSDPALAGIPVVMMTSRNSPDDVERGLSLGANAYVTKQDFDQGTLLSVIGQLV